MVRHLYLPLLLLSLAAARPVLAQTPAAAADTLQHQHSGHCHCCCHGRHSTRIVTEQNNRTAFLMSAGVVGDQAGRAYAGFGLEIGRAITPCLTLGGRGWVSVARNSASNYDYDATAPALAIHTLAGSARYQLLNARRWRLAALGGLGIGAVQLVDRDQTVVSYGKYGRNEHPATVFFSVHPLVEAGTAFTYKVGPQFWLTSEARYRWLPGTGGLGAAGEFSGWQASLSATVPWGWRPRQRLLHPQP